MEREKPVKEGGTYTLDIERMETAARNRQDRGLVVFVEDAVPGTGWRLK